MTTSAQPAGAESVDPSLATTRAGDGRRVLRAGAAMAAIWALIWVSAYYSERRLFYIKPGSEIMYVSKARYMETHPVFAPDKPVKVLVLGNSKVMSGFIPEQFDLEVPGAASFNAGFPNSSHFLPQLRAMLAQGEVPTHVLYMVDWRDSAPHHPTLFHFLPSDREIMDKLFPFRLLMRNVTVFLLRSRKFGGIKASYRNAENQEQKMEQARGYYFIENESRFADHHLPADFHLAGDDASLIPYRNPAPNSDSFRELKALADQYHFRIVVMPYYLRNGERGVPGKNVQMATTFQSYPEFRVQGDEYYIFDNRYFSDTAHLNPEGAQIYTDRIAGLMNAELAAEERK